MKGRKNLRFWISADKVRKNLRYWLTAAAITITIVSVIRYGRQSNGIWTAEELRRHWWMYVLLGCWFVLPPMWFLLDEYLNGPKVGDAQFKEKLDRFKFQQELARNLWVAMSVGLAALLAVGIKGL